MYSLDDEGTSPETMPPASQKNAGPPRYRRLRAHAAGGLGEVWVALDGELHREVALKEVKDAFADQNEARARFLLEAEVTGQLEHPGIVPVYGMGAYPDGRPYYAMRFIRGVTLQEALAQFHRADQQPGRDPGERALSLRRLLAHFVAVCHTIAYAHNRGVIHRDIKPGNIMLGDFGETLVVDWGLAQVVRNTAERTEPLVALRLPHESAGSQPPGAPAGTPAYMPPEQARGDVALVGPLSDVYGLGATLYAVLTGKPPHGAGPEALRRAANAEAIPARQANPLVPPALEAVSLKALQPRPEQRYPSAMALAADVERWLADEPVSVYPEPPLTRLARLASRHRLLVAVGLTLLLACLVGLGVGLVFVRAEQARTAEQRDLALEAEARANQNLERAEANLKLTRQAEARAKQNLQRAEANLTLARQAVDQLYKLAREHPGMQGDSNKGLRREVLLRALPFFRDFRFQAGDDPKLLEDHADLLLRVGYITDEIGQKEDALRFYRQALEAQTKVVQAMPGDSAHEGTLAGLYNNIANAQEALGQTAEALSAHREAIRLRVRLAGRHPTPLNQAFLAQSRLNLAVLLLGQSRLPEARAQLESALALAKKLPDTPGNRVLIGYLLGNLGNVLDEQNQREAALKAYRAALALQAPLAEKHPEKAILRYDVASTRCNLGVTLRAAGRLDDAGKQYALAREALEELVKQYRDMVQYRVLLARAHSNEAALLRAQKNYEEAVASAREAVRLMTDVVAAHPGPVGYRITLRNNHFGAAAALSLWSKASKDELARSRAEQGLEHLRQAVLVPGLGPGNMREALDKDAKLAALRALPGFKDVAALLGKAKPR